MKNSKPVLVDNAHMLLDGDDISSDEFNITTPFDTSKIRVETKTPQMDALIKRIRDGAINLQPDFQRLDGVWNEVGQSRLIESMLIKIPLPAFYMDATDNENWLVVDGLQRLTTIKKFVVDKELELKGLEFLTDYNGKTFDDLPRSFQRRIEETDIVLYLIQPGTPVNVKFDIFKRINTGGRVLSAQEIRHALNQGKVTFLLKELADSDLFKEATDSGVAPARMDDRECVLRFLAFSIFPLEEYAIGDFDKFLNRAMEFINQTDDKTICDYRSRFFCAMQAAIDIFGTDAFRKRFDKNHNRYIINKALFETFSVALGELKEEEIVRTVKNRELLKLEFSKLLSEDKEFESSISQGTGSVRKVKYRFTKIKELIGRFARD